jgi:hypothetical protein
VENDVDIDVCVTTVPQKLQELDFREFKQQFLNKSGFLFPFIQVTNRKLFVVKDDV